MPNPNPTTTPVDRMIAKSSVPAHLRSIVPTASQAAYVLSLATFGEVQLRNPTGFRDYMAGGQPAATTALDSLNRTAYASTSKKVLGLDSVEVIDPHRTLLRELMAMAQDGRLDGFYPEPVRPLLWASGIVASRLGDPCVD
jgi:hypothetical protein